MNTVENNKLIAEFMGYEILYRPYSNGFIELSETELCDVDDLKYHTSWDWLIPVVEKIEDIQDGDMGDAIRVHQHDVVIRQFTTEITGTEILVDYCESKIANTYEAVILFIQWYNETVKSK